MICVICGKPVQQILAGYSVCSAHAASLSPGLLLEVSAADHWYRMWRKHHLESQGMRY